MICPACVIEMPEEDLFCENCGLKLGDPAPDAPEAPQARCICGAPASETDEDGFCLRCGLRARRSESAEPAREPDPTDRIEQQLSPQFAAVSDRGRRHAKNEDRFGILEIGEAYAMVVCDGVSTSQTAEVASTVVTAAILESLSISLSAATPPDANPDASAAIRHAIAAGAAALNAHTNPYTEENPPSTTVVAALVIAGAATIGWLGDSRAYWIDLSNSIAIPLTHDHSWLNAVVGAGEMTPELAARSPQAHAITRWVGADAVADLEIDIVRHPLPASNGILLLCTDGLWNYFPTPEAMAGIVQNASQSGQDALAIARQLVDLANRRGGHDNITAAVLIHHQPQSGEPQRED